MWKLVRLEIDLRLCLPEFEPRWLKRVERFVSVCFFEIRDRSVDFVVLNLNFVVESIENE